MGRRHATKKEEEITWYIIGTVKKNIQGHVSMEGKNGQEKLTDIGIYGPYSKGASGTRHAHT